MSSVFVVDSWPLIEWVYGKEPVLGRFRDLLDRAERKELSLHMSRINFGEVVYTLKRKFPAKEANAKLADIIPLPINVVSVEDAFVNAAADPKAMYRFSYADAFPAALAISLEAQRITGDKEFLPLQRDGSPQLHWLGA